MVNLLVDISEASQFSVWFLIFLRSLNKNIVILNTALFLELSEIFMIFFLSGKNCKKLIKSWVEVVLRQICCWYPLSLSYPCSLHGWPYRHGLWQTMTQTMFLIIWLTALTIWWIFKNFFLLILLHLPQQAPLLFNCIA